jgi:dimethylaniline monooxygenase (N-oxide forming)
VGLFNYTDTPMPRNGTTKADLVTGAMIHKYLNRYAEDHDLLSRIRFSSFVERIERAESGMWQLFIRDAGDFIEAEKVLIATGVTSIPYMPEDFDFSHASIPVIHSKDLGAHYEQLRSEKIRRVVIVGAAKSAYDAVHFLVGMDKEITWCIRPDGAGPLAILPTKILGLANSIAIASTRLMTHLSPSILNTSGPLYRFFQKSNLGRWVTSTFWDFLDYVSHRHAGYHVGNHIAALKPEIESKR